MITPCQVLGRDHIAPLGHIRQQRRLGLCNQEPNYL
jgi:hypothetical protein